ncbi:MMPL family transporter [Guyparkeria hydrothermalis]|uniref:MMPL family transporter n=1 Tax=Guyparkeria hydrothermalis TaxID=923 RepID=UPI0020216089|nr:MMPL family transporter [Guyparkeria hydrothermalis]MCL7743811.1 MMPL family transporter [Guyparkeria hydrothermalis]
MTRRFARAPFLLTVWLVVIVAAIGITTQTRFTADMSAFLPASPTDAQRLLVEQLQQGGISRTFLIGIEGGTSENRAEASNLLKDRLRDDPAFATVQNGSRADLDRAREHLFAHRYLLSPAVDADRFSVDGLNAAIGHSIEQLNSPLGDMMAELFPRDPTGEMLALLDDRDGDGPARCCGVWSSESGERTLLIAQVAASGSDTDALAQAHSRIEDTFRSVRASVASDMSLTIAGSPAFAIAARDTIKTEVTWFSAASLLLVTVVLLAAYRSIRVLLAGLLPVASGVVVGIAAVSLGFDQVHGITIGFGTALMGEAIDYSIYFFVQSRQADDSQAGQRHWVRHYWPTIRLGLITSLIGFAALLFSGFPGLMQIGVYAMTGLITAALVTRYILPIFGSRLPRADIAGLGYRLASPLQALRRFRLPALVAGGIALVIVVLGSNELWRGTLSGLVPIDPALEAADARLRDDLGSASPRYLVVVTGRDREAALQQAERVTPILDRLVASGALAGYRSPTDVLPSKATQTARQSALPAPEDLRQRLESALADLPVSADRLDGFVEDVARQRNSSTMDLASLKGTPLWLAVAGQLPSDGQQRQLAMMTLQEGSDGRLDIAAIRQAIAPVASATLVDMLGESNRLYAHYLDTTLAVALLGAVAIVLLLFAVQRAPRRTLRTLLPIALAVLLVLAGHRLAGGGLTLLHLIGLLLTVAVGSNYALFFQPREQRDVMGARTLASLTLANATTVSAFGVLSLSSVPVLQAIGAVVAPGALAAFLLAAVFAREPDGNRNQVTEPHA